MPHISDRWLNLGIAIAFSLVVILWGFTLKQYGWPDLTGESAITTGRTKVHPTGTVVGRPLVRPTVALPTDAGRKDSGRTKVRPTGTVVGRPLVRPTVALPTDAGRTAGQTEVHPTGTPVVRSALAGESLRSRPTATRSTTDLTSLATSLQRLNEVTSRPGRITINRQTKLVLAHYFAWYDDTGWHDCNISAGDSPLQPYHSDDPAAIARHVELARQVGLDGFTLHWFTPGDRTDRNFSTLLAKSAGQNFQSTVVFSRHIYHGGGASQQTVAEALRYIIEQYSQHANFLKVDGRPVIFFTDVYRVPSGSPHQFWATMRQLVDPNQQTIWIAEGLDASYLSVFDGLYVFKISHATAPHDYRKSPYWGQQVRQMGQSKLWVATIGPGWDDRRAGCRDDVRVPAPAHQVDRGDGAFYRATFEAAIDSDPDWLIISSFNEWVEGSYIEPSQFYGSRYMELTEQLIKKFKQH